MSSMKTTSLYHKPRIWYILAFKTEHLSFKVLPLELFHKYTVPKDKHTHIHTQKCTHVLADRAVNQVLSHKVDITVKLY